MTTTILFEKKYYKFDYNYIDNKVTNVKLNEGELILFLIDCLVKCEGYVEHTKTIINDKIQYNICVDNIVVSNSPD